MRTLYHTCPGAVAVAAFTRHYPWKYLIRRVAWLITGPKLLVHRFTCGDNLFVSDAHIRQIFYRHIAAFVSILPRCGIVSTSITPWVVTNTYQLPGFLNSPSF
ncbi:hypothetical protein [Marinicauda salina]|uniref:hypothetical protein n=1 Tax=Marinicauda salina TaxID=2135793 RepID=UPI0011B29842|nr:hypothetical protein [Marinicauda salina]